MEPQPNPHVAAMSAYTPGEQPQGGGWTKLNTNENPYAPSPAAVTAARAAIGEDGGVLRLYPSPDSRDLRAAAAAFHGLPQDHVLAGNGSDDVLNLLIRAYAGPGRAVGMLDPSYSLYPVLAAAQHAPVVRVPITADLTFDPESVAGSGCTVFFLTNPNAPLGVAFARERVAAAARAFPGLLVVDEAYAAFAPADCVGLVREHANVAVTRTLSKSHALAGLRAGYVLARPGVIALLDRVRDSYNLDRVAQAAAAAALADRAWLDSTVARILASRERMASGLRGLGWQVGASATNFLLAVPTRPGAPVSAATGEHAFEYLRMRRILVRRFPSHPLTAPALRITVGTDPEVDACLAAAADWTAGRG